MISFIQGHLDTCSSRGISGWAYCPTQPLAKVDILCAIDGHVIACTPADQFRPDLESAGIGDGQHAFRLSIPIGFYDGEKHTVTLRASHDDVVVELIGSPTEFCFSSSLLIDGDFTIGDDGLLQGWVVDKATPSRTVSVDVLAEGVGQIRLAANIYRRDLLAFGDGLGRHGFQAVLPRAWYDQNNLSIQVYESKSRIKLKETPVRFDTESSYFKLCQMSENTRVTRPLLQNKPLISVVLPVYNPDPRFLEEAIQSVKLQTYSHWQLCIADDASPNPEIKNILQKHAAQDDRIQLVIRTENGHISASSNSALQLAQGEFIALLDHDDLLHPDALLEVAHTICQYPDVGIIFTDEDKCDEYGMRYSPYHKTGWDPELLLGQNCVSHLGVYRTSLVRDLGGFRMGFEGSQDYDLALRASRALSNDQIQHIARPLYHWRAIPGSTALANSEKSYAYVAMHKALSSHLHAIGSEAYCEPAVLGTYCRVRWPLPDPLPSVTLALPLAKYCTSTAALGRKITALNWPGMQIVSCTTQATDPVADIKTRRSEYLHAVATAAKGDVFVWLEQALPVGDLKDWLSELVSQALRGDVGIIGTKVIDQTKHVLNAGISFLTPTNEAQYNALYRGLSVDDPGLGGAAGLSRSVQAVSSHAFACRRTTLSILLADRSTVEDIPIITELSLRAKKRGLRTLVTPFANTMSTLIHKHSHH